MQTPENAESITPPPSFEVIAEHFKELDDKFRLLGEQLISLVESNWEETELYMPKVVRRLLSIQSTIQTTSIEIASIKDRRSKRNPLTDLAKTFETFISLDHTECERTGTCLHLKKFGL